MHVTINSIYKEGLLDQDPSMELLESDGILIELGNISQSLRSREIKFSTLAASIYLKSLHLLAYSRKPKVSATQICKHQFLPLCISD